MIVTADRQLPRRRRQAPDATPTLEPALDWLAGDETLPPGERYEALPELPTRRYTCVGELARGGTHVNSAHAERQSVDFFYKHSH